MKVSVLFFASLREQVGVPREDVELPGDASTAGALRSHLSAQCVALTTALSEGRRLRMAVNQDMAQASTAIKSGDEVAFFPPVTGG